MSSSFQSSVKHPCPTLADVVWVPVRFVRSVHREQFHSISLSTVSDDPKLAVFVCDVCSTNAALALDAEYRCFAKSSRNPDCVRDSAATNNSNQRVLAYTRPIYVAIRQIDQ